TLDLNGFTISSTASSISGAGVRLSYTTPLENIRILNGHIIGTTVYQGGGTYSGGGFEAGIEYGYYGYAGVRIERISVRNCYIGILLGGGGGEDYHPAVIDSCTVYS